MVVHYMIMFTEEKSKAVGNMEKVVTILTVCESDCAVDVIYASRCPEMHLTIKQKLGKQTKRELETKTTKHKFSVMFLAKLK